MSDMKRLDEAERLGVPKQDIVPTDKSVQDFVAESGLQGKIDIVIVFVGEKQTFEDAQHIGKQSLHSEKTDSLLSCSYCA